MLKLFELNILKEGTVTVSNVFNFVTYEIFWLWFCPHFGLAQLLAKIIAHLPKASLDLRKDLYHFWLN